MGNVDMIISLWRKAPRNFHEERLAVSQSWFESSKAPEPDADMETGVVTPTHKEAPPTVLDSTQEFPEPEGQGNKRKQESPAKKTRSPPIGSAPGDLRSSPVKPPPKKARDETCSGEGPAGVKLWDLGGEGQCGLRMLAGFQDLRNGKTKEQIAEKASALSLTLRTKIAACLATGKSFQQTWFADAGATVDTEAGNPATTWQEYIETVKRPHKWADSWMIQAAAVVLKTEVHVFKWCRRSPKGPLEWVYLDVCRPTHKSKSTPLVLCLKDGHFTGVDPDSVLPVDVYEEEPLSQQLEKSASVYRGSGKLKSACSSWLGSPASSRGLPKTLKDDSSVSSWLKPAESVKSAKTKRLCVTPRDKGQDPEDASSVLSWIKPARSDKVSPKGSGSSSSTCKPPP